MKNFKLFLFLLIVSGLVSCEDYSEPNRRYIQRISNESDFDIVVRTFKIPTGSQLLEIPIQSKNSYEKDSTLKTAGDAWSFREFLLGDSAQIIFSDGKVLTFKCFQGEGCEKENNIFNSATKTTEEDKRLKTIITTYTITNREYERAE